MLVVWRVWIFMLGGGDIIMYLCVLEAAKFSFIYFSTF